MDEEIESDLEDVSLSLDDHLDFLTKFDTSNKLTSDEDVVLYKTSWTRCASILSDILRNIDEASDKVLSSLSTFAKSVANEVFKISRKKSSISDIDVTLAPFLLPIINSLCRLANLFPSEKFLWSSNASRVSEYWFTLRFPKHELSEKFSIVYLLSQLLKKPTLALIERMSLLQTAIKPEVLEDEYIEQLLIEVSQSKCIIQSKHGIGFLAYLFTLSKDFAENLHDALKKMIPGISKDQARAYGRVYYEAWLRTSGDQRNVILYSCIQNFMLDAIAAKRNVPKSEKTFHQLLKILASFKKSSNSKEIQLALFELWEPILRHRLFARDHHVRVRVNACQCFFSAFPLENPNDSLTQKTIMKATQVQTMLYLLNDKKHQIRAAAAVGICHILAKYWQIPFDHDRLIEELIKGCNRDPSFQVRKGVLDGMAFLVRKCPGSRKYLKDVLPRLSGSLFNERLEVRHAMLDLLLEIRKNNEIQIWDVSPMKDLLLQFMKEDKIQICSKIVNLLKPSYFEEGKTTLTKLQRCVVFNQREPQASKKFYYLLPQNTSVTSCIRFVLETLYFVELYLKNLAKENVQSSAVSVGTKRILSDQNLTHSSIPKRRALSTFGSPTRCTSKDLDAITTPQNEHLAMPDSSFQRNDSVSTNNQCLVRPSAMSKKHRLLLRAKEIFNKPDVIVRLLEALCFLSFGLHKLFAKEGSKYTKIRRFFQTQSAGWLIKIVPLIKNDNAFRPLVGMSCLIQKSLVRNIEIRCWTRVVNDSFLPTFRSGKKLWNPTDFGSFCDSALTPLMVAGLHNWGRGRELLDILDGWLSQDTRAKTTDTIQSVDTAKIAGTGSQSNTDFPKRAVCILDFLLNYDFASTKVVDKYKERLDKLPEILEKKYLPKILEAAKSRDNREDEFLIHTFGLLLKIRVLLFEKTRNPIQTMFISKCWDQLDRLFKWQLGSESSLPNCAILQKTSFELVMASLRLASKNAIDRHLLPELIAIISNLLHRTSDFEAVGISMDFAIEVCKIRIFDEDRLSALVLAIASGISREKGWNCDVFESNKQRMMTLLSMSAPEMETRITDVLKCILVFIVKDITTEIEKAKSHQSSSLSDLDLPPVSTFWCDVLAHNEDILKNFMIMWSKIVGQISPNKDVEAQIILLKSFSKRSHLNVSIRSVLDEINNHVEKHFFELDDPEVVDISMIELVNQELLAILT